MAVIVRLIGLWALVACVQAENPAAVEAPAGAEPVLVAEQPVANLRLMGEWVVASGKDMVADPGITIRFVTGRISGKMPINSYLGSFKMERDKKLGFSGIVVTKRGGDAAKLHIENQYTGLLTKVRTYQYETTTVPADTASPTGRIIHRLALLDEAGEQILMLLKEEKVR